MSFNIKTTHICVVCPPPPCTLSTLPHITSKTSACEFEPKPIFAARSLQPLGEDSINRLAVYCYSVALSSFTSRWPAVLNTSTERMNHAECRPRWHYTTAGARTSRLTHTQRTLVSSSGALDISILHCCVRAESEVRPGWRDRCLTL